MSAPSADQMGENSSAASKVNRVRSPRAGLTIQTSPVLSLELARLTAALSPSGDRRRSRYGSRSSRTAVWLPFRSDQTRRAVPPSPYPW